MSHDTESSGLPALMSEPQWWEHYKLSEVCVGGSSAPGCRDHRDRGGEGRDKGRGGEEKKGEWKGGRASSVYLDPCKGTSVKVSDLQPPPNWGTHRVESEQITHAYCFV